MVATLRWKTSALPWEDRNNGPSLPPSPIPGLRGGSRWARTCFSSRCPPRFLNVSRHPQRGPPTASHCVGRLSLGRGTQRCSDLPRPSKRLAATSGPPLPDPGFPALEGGWRDGEWSQKPQRRARYGVTGAQKMAQSEPLSALPADPALPTPRPPPHPPDSQFVFPSTHFLLFFSAHAHLNSNLSGN